MVIHKFPSIIEFKEAHLEKEFLSNRLDSRLYVITLALAGYVYFNFGKTLQITEIFRDQKTQDMYYKDNEKYQIKPWSSVHQYGRGIDISLRNFTNDEIRFSDKFVNESFLYTSSKNLKTLKIHNIGFGYHGHLQVDKDNFTTIKKINKNF